MKNIFISFFILTALLFLPVCSNADSEQNKINSSSQSNFVAKAKNVTKKFNLTKVKISCLIFEKLDGEIERKVIFDVRELHGGACGGDPSTSPRLFSIGFDKTNGEVWSDAKSLVGQMEKLK